MAKAKLAAAPTPTITSTASVKSGHPPEEPAHASSSTRPATIAATPSRLALCNCAPQTAVSVRLAFAGPAPSNHVTAFPHEIDEPKAVAVRSSSSLATPTMNSAAPTIPSHLLLPRPTFVSLITVAPPEERYGTSVRPFPTRFPLNPVCPPLWVHCRGSRRSRIGTSGSLWHWSDRKARWMRGISQRCRLRSRARSC